MKNLYENRSGDYQLFPVLSNQAGASMLVIKNRCFSVVFPLIQLPRIILYDEFCRVIRLHSKHETNLSKINI